MKEESFSSSDEYHDEEIRETKHHRKRRKVISELVPSAELQNLSFQPLLDQLDSYEDATFDSIFDNLLPDYLRVRGVLQNQAIELDQQGQPVRPLTRSEVTSFIDATDNSAPLSLYERIRYRKLKLMRERRRSGLPELDIQSSGTVTPLGPPPACLPVQSQVIDALHSIRTTPFENSFLSRLRGTWTHSPVGAIAVDWEIETPWMSLMTDIREHHALYHPERERSAEALAPITYTSLQPCHLEQVHDLLEQSFWRGINVSDSFDHSPERCTIVATYKRLVVGIAILSSPRETYITYLAVKAGWDNARIARSMLYHLIMLNPNKDITLHVSVNSSAMLLYNRFGFKAEEFVAGFYEDYLDPQSRASKNAFRLRLRQQ